MSARFGLVGNTSSWPHLGLSQAIVSRGGGNKKWQICCFFSLVSHWALFTRFGPLLPSTRGGAIGTCLSTLLGSWWKLRSLPQWHLSRLGERIQQACQRPLSRLLGHHGRAAKGWYCTLPDVLAPGVNFSRISISSP